MIDRYSLPGMKEIWSEEAKLQNWLQIEVLACEAMVELGLVPPEALVEVKRKARFDVERVKEIEQRTHHDVVAFLENLAENIGEAARFLHFGMTSSDILDTGLAIQMRDAAEILIEGTSRLMGMLKNKALEHRDTVMIGRTHGVHAEPLTFGVKLAVWAFETRRNLDRLMKARNMVSCGKISGAVGTYASIDPFVEKYVCDRLGLKTAEASTQILQRDRHAEYMAAAAIAASSLEKFATEIRGLQRTEVTEVEEPFREGQTGSSAMPHKRNPIICERVCGLARVIRGNSQVALENVALWHERDISHSSAERVIIPDSTILLDYITNKFIEVMEGMVVYPWKMEKNLELTQGLIFSERVLLTLVSKGVTRQEAYTMVQRNAMRAVRGEEGFHQGLLHDKEVGRYLTPEEIEGCFDVREALQRTDKIFARLEGLKVKP
ncbi:MAG: adenylosuccinate lyase [Actinobacteria bacterium]|nr:adenylosuccinate lyase [Actinomycetota bacterium]MCG2819091.1 adenylosuccinate lyase [Actinomycetes bacterium]MBU4218698.1 adenylosuccinate lyase [Actinomycetota bacterium]MBU4359427.1 adenylosuccinate lyase [Actinomycetota bacterium]MBU4391298.1 adenylosuccinate lyase [Actinomycetota bacterium]